MKKDLIHRVSVLSFIIQKENFGSAADSLLPDLHYDAMGSECKKVWPHSQIDFLL